jgi:hypothetical protein
MRQLYLKLAFSLLLLALLSPAALAQRGRMFNPDSLLAGPAPAVLLVGSFHFQYYNLDAHKVDKAQQVDILSEARQKELRQLLDYLALFKPTKIVIEATPRWNATGRYRDYRQGKQPLGRDERYQIAFRLMERFRLDTVYAVDAQPLADELESRADTAAFRPYLRALYQDWDFRSDDPASQRYTDQRLARDYGAYLTGDFKLGDTRGADALTLHWYSRNLRIFRKIQQIRATPQDRVLVLFGAGHVSVLRQLFDASPEYRLVPFNSLK